VLLKHFHGRREKRSKLEEIDPDFSQGLHLVAISPYANDKERIVMLFLQSMRL